MRKGREALSQRERVNGVQTQRLWRGAGFVRRPLIFKFNPP
jgi:hypothetical protein